MLAPRQASGERRSYAFSEAVLKDAAAARSPSVPAAKLRYLEISCNDSPDINKNPIDFAVLTYYPAQPADTGTVPVGDPAAGLKLPLTAGALSHATTASYPGEDEEVSETEARRAVRPGSARPRWPRSQESQIKKILQISELALLGGANKPTSYPEPGPRSAR